MTEVGGCYTAFSPSFCISVEAIMATASGSENKSSGVTIWVQTALTSVHCIKYVKSLREKFGATKCFWPGIIGKKKPSPSIYVPLFCISSQWQACHEVAQEGELCYTTKSNINIQIAEVFWHPGRTRRVP